MARNVQNESHVRNKIQVIYINSKSRKPVPSINENSKEYKSWCFEMRTLTESVSLSLEMIFNSEFLSDPAEFANPMTQIMLQSLKDIYIPEIILWYHEMLSETESFMTGNNAKIFGLLNLLTDSNTAYYEEFLRSGKLSNFLISMRRTCLLSLKGSTSLAWSSQMDS